MTQTQYSVIKAILTLILIGEMGVRLDLHNGEFWFTLIYVNVVIYIAEKVSKKILKKE